MYLSQPSTGPWNDPPVLRDSNKVFDICFTFAPTF